MFSRSVKSDSAGRVFPHWPAIREFAVGQVNALEVSGQAQISMVYTYSFDDVHAMVGDITRSFTSFWESECRTMGEALGENLGNTGRVPLSKLSDTGSPQCSRPRNCGVAKRKVRESRSADATGHEQQGKVAKIARSGESAAASSSADQQSLTARLKSQLRQTGRRTSGVRRPLQRTKRTARTS